MDARQSHPLQAAQNVLLMVAELHKRGFERLRIVPGMSASGTHWRVVILPASRVLRSHGALTDDWRWGSTDPFFTTGQATGYFGWTDSEGDPPESLADKFLMRYSEIAEQSRGSDPAYATWYRQMIEFAKSGELPVAYADWFDEQPDPHYLATTVRIKSDLPMPPPGEKEQ